MNMRVWGGPFDGHDNAPVESAPEDGHLVALPHGSLIAVYLRQDMDLVFVKTVTREQYEQAMKDCTGETA